MMTSPVILRIQSVRCHKMCVRTAKLLCFLIHHRRKSFHRTSDMFRDRDRGIVVALQHQRVQKVFQIILLSFLDTKPYIWLRGSIGRNLYIIIAFTVFQGKDAGQDFRGACIRSRCFALFFIQDTPRIPIHQNCRKRIKISGRTAFPGSSTDCGIYQKNCYDQNRDRDIISAFHIPPLILYRIFYADLSSLYVSVPSGSSKPVSRYKSYTISRPAVCLLLKV